MPKKPQDLKQTFLQKYPAMQERVDKQNKGLTLRQSKVALYMLTYLQEREKILTKELKDATIHVESTEEWARRLIINWNSLTDFLDEQFSIKVRGGVDLEDRSEVWTVEYAGGKSSHKTMWEAFAAGIEASLQNREEVK